MIALTLALTSIAQTKNIPTFSNEKAVVVQKFNPQGFSWLKVDSILTENKIYFKVQDSSLYLDIPVKDLLEHTTHSMMGTTVNFFLQRDILSLEFYSGSPYTTKAPFLLVLKLSAEDKKAFEAFQKNTMPKLK